MNEAILIQVHGVDAEGGTVIRRQLRRRYVLSFLNKQPSCLLGIEACAVHTWLRSEVPAFLIDVRSSPNNRHSDVDVCLYEPVSVKAGLSCVATAPASRSIASLWVFAVYPMHEALRR